MSHSYLSLIPFAPIANGRVRLKNVTLRTDTHAERASLLSLKQARTAWPAGRGEGCACRLAGKTRQGYKVCSCCHNDDHDALRLLSNDIVLLIVTWLPVATIRHAALVRRQWDFTLSSELLWEHLLARDYASFSTTKTQSPRRIQVFNHRTSSIEAVDYTGRSFRHLYQMAKTKEFVPRVFSERLRHQQLMIIIMAFIASPLILFYLSPRIITSLASSGKVWLRAFLYFTFKTLAQIVRGPFLPSVVPLVKTIYHFLILRPIYVHMVVILLVRVICSFQWTYETIVKPAYRFLMIHASRFMFHRILAPTAEIACKIFLWTHHHVLKPIVSLLFATAIKNDSTIATVSLARTVKRATVWLKINIFFPAAVFLFHTVVHSLGLRPSGDSMMIMVIWIYKRLISLLTPVVMVFSQTIPRAVCSWVIIPRWRKVIHRLFVYIFVGTALFCVHTILVPLLHNVSVLRRWAREQILNQIVSSTLFTLFLLDHVIFPFGRCIIVVLRFVLIRGPIIVYTIVLLPSERCLFDRILSPSASFLFMTSPQKLYALLCYSAEAIDEVVSLSVTHLIRPALCFLNKYALHHTWRVISAMLLYTLVTVDAFRSVTETILRGEIARTINRPQIQHVMIPVVLCVLCSLCVAIIPVIVLYASVKFSGDAIGKTLLFTMSCMRRGVKWVWLQVYIAAVTEDGIRLFFFLPLWRDGVATTLFLFCNLLPTVVRLLCCWFRMMGDCLVCLFLDWVLPQLRAYVTGAKTIVKAFGEFVRSGLVFVVDDVLEPATAFVTLIYSKVYSATAETLIAIAQGVPSTKAVHAALSNVGEALQVLLNVVLQLYVELSNWVKSKLP